MAVIHHQEDRSIKKLLVTLLLAALIALSLTACNNGFVHSTAPATEVPTAMRTATAATMQAPTAQPTDAPAEIEASDAPAVN